MQRPIIAFAMKTHRSRPVTALAAAVALLLGACATPVTDTLPNGRSRADFSFKPVEKISVNMPSKEELALLEESINPVYQFGSGDVVRVDVFGRPEVSGKFVIGPDGMITMPLVGDVFLNQLTREEAQAALVRRLREFFSHPHVTLGGEDYTSNVVTVLGRVASAGRQRFPHPPTLVEVLANAGALPILDKQATLTRCAIIRGRDKLIWVDLKALLNGDLGYNIRMKKGDIVFIPDSSETAVYVLGAVPKPGSYRLTPSMTVLDVLAQAGGPTNDAAPEKIGIYRASSRQTQILSFSELIGPNRTVNHALEDGDVLFVPTSGLADFGYFLRQISPAISVLTFGMTLDTYMNQNQ
jgi:polysaccharide export outer membrane protein